MFSKRRVRSASDGRPAELEARIKAYADGRFSARPADEWKEF